MKRPSRRLFVQLLLFLVGTLPSFADSPANCTSTFTNGRTQVSCENKNLDDIPVVDTEAQYLVLNNNHIRVLKDYRFLHRGLQNLQTLFIRNGGVEEIEKYAFSNLSIIVRIDLNDNLITKLDPDTFKSTVKLRMLFLNNNKLQTIPDGLFHNLIQLQTIELNDNEISYISAGAFFNLPKLTTVNLNGNRLTHVELSTFIHLERIQGLELKGNLWNCDCHLRDFVEWFNRKNLYTHATVCHQPAFLQNRTWNNISLSSFACKPKILALESRVDEDHGSIHLSCRVEGNPRPETYIMYQSRILDNTTALQRNGDRKYTNYGFVGNDSVLNVTVHRMNQQDYGVYICSARNDAGLAETNLTLDGEVTRPIFGGSAGIDLWVMLSSLFIGVVCVLVLIFLSCFLCCRRRRKMATKKQSNMKMNGDLTHHIIMEPEQQKTLLTAVNPVQKPPRKYDSPLDNGGTELMELNRNLLDDSSISGGAHGTGDLMDDRHSTTSLEQLSSCNSQDNLLLGHDRFRPVAARIHPPDLLPFSSRRRQASPASSSVSTDLDSTRIRTLHSPARSPIYHTMHPSHAYTPPYETLPHSRTQSPFSPTSSVGSGVPIFTHRQGYVTIPRRPRVSSWSRDVSTPTLEAAMRKGFVPAEPTYDNLGKRTTADGSSVLSLPRRVGVESPALRSARTPVPSPYYTSQTLPHKAKLNHAYLKLRDSDQAQLHPLIQEQNGVIRPLPLQFMPNGDLEAKRSSWATPTARSTPETGTLKRPSHETNGGGSTSSSSPPPVTKSKVPPQPPPKPKKNGPLFEDEGEDGTEV